MSFPFLAHLYRGKTILTANVSSFDRKGESFSKYAKGVELRNRVANLGRVAGEVCPAAGNDKIIRPEGLAEGLQVLHAYFAPDAVGPAYQRVGRFR